MRGWDIGKSPLGLVLLKPTFTDKGLIVTGWPSHMSGRPAGSEWVHPGGLSISGPIDRRGSGPPVHRIPRHHGPPGNAGGG